MPDAPAPASRVAMTAGGFAFRSTTVSVLSAVVLVGSLGSIFVDAEISARLSSGVMATLDGGPTTLVGTLSTRPITLGSGPFRSRITMLSGTRLGSTLTTPSVSFGFVSFPDTAISAAATDPDARTSAYGTRMARPARASLIAPPLLETLLSRGSASAFDGGAVGAGGPGTWIGSRRPLAAAKGSLAGAAPIVNRE